ncbi:tetratricopeptide repeat protein [Streptomyces sp. NPDC101225]|uniref:tetratricopeptide repeat protein n=1 Tax=Streptomyces sp. NPDC101225 TaxID=3366135 RepID=UPI003819E426
MKHLIYEAYAAAGAPTLDDMAGAVAADDELRASPSRDTIHRLIADAAALAKQADAVALVTVLTRMAGGDGAQAGREVATWWTRARLAEPVGRPIADVGPYELEVHHAITLPGGNGRLPAYVRRAHDDELRRIVATAAAGSSGVVMLVGTPSTGKTRACFEAIQQLPDAWRLWHPIAPDRPRAARADLDRVGPRTVVWLNDAHHYLFHDEDGEAIAAGLRMLLADASRAPVLVMGTIWSGPGYYERLQTAVPRGYADPCAQARVLLADRCLHVPEAFTADEVQALHRSGDARLVAAAASAQDGMITQFLAAGFDLLHLYETAPPGPRALLDAAIDARRLGHPPGLPLPFLAAAAEGYLNDTQWALLEDNWLEQALSQLTAAIKGARGPLHPQKRPRGAFTQPLAAPGQLYRLADFLDSYGRTTRRLQRIPALLWHAALQHCDLETARTLATAAAARGLLEPACRLWAKAGADRHVAQCLARAGRLDEALPWFERASERGDRTALGHAAMELAAAGRLDEALPWFERACSNSDNGALRHAAEKLADAGRLDEALSWFERAGATDDAESLLVAAEELADAGRLDEALVWYENAWKAGETDACWLAARRLTEQDRLEQALVWFQRAAPTDDPVRNTAQELAGQGRPRQALSWLKRATSTTDPEKPYSYRS